MSKILNMRVLDVKSCACVGVCMCECANYVHARPNDLRVMRGMCLGACETASSSDTICRARTSYNALTSDTDANQSPPLADAELAAGRAGKSTELFV